MKRSFVKLLTGLITAYWMSRWRGAEKAAKETANETVSEPVEVASEFLLDEPPRLHESPGYGSVVIQAVVALVAVVVTALVAESRRSTEPPKEVPATDDVQVPSEATLKNHLRIYKENLAKATALRAEQGDLDPAQNKILDAKFDDMRSTITMTEELIAHLASPHRRRRRRVDGDGDIFAIPPIPE